LEKGGDTNGYSSFIGLNHREDWGFVALTNVNDDDFQQVISHAICPQTAEMPIMWAIVPKEASSLSGTYVIEKGSRAITIFKYKGDLYASVPATTPAKLTPLHPNRYSWDALGITLTFHVDRNGNATDLTAVQGGRTMQAKKM
jgi:hypothetical protein